MNVTLYGGDFADMIKDLKMDRLFWISGFALNVTVSVLIRGKQRRSQTEDTM